MEIISRNLIHKEVKMKLLEVCAAILVYQKKFLCVKRGQGKYAYISFKYEFPGGKIEPGEKPKEALRRELNEEMDINISMDDMKFFYTVDHKYPDFEITMHSFLCMMKSEVFHLNEHVDFKWMSLENLDELDWAPADLPIVMELKEKGLQIYEHFRGIVD